MWTQKIYPRLAPPVTITGGSEVNTYGTYVDKRTLKVIR